MQRQIAQFLTYLRVERGASPHTLKGYREDLIAAAGVGLVSAARRERTVLVWLCAAFGPYFVFDLLFQEMVTTRYALPSGESMKQWWPGPETWSLGLRIGPALDFVHDPSGDLAVARPTL